MDSGMFIYKHLYKYIIMYRLDHFTYKELNLKMNHQILGKSLRCITLIFSAHDLHCKSQSRCSAWWLTCPHPTPAHLDSIPSSGFWAQLPGNADFSRQQTWPWEWSFCHSFRQLGLPSWLRTGLAQSWMLPWGVNSWWDSLCSHLLSLFFFSVSQISVCVCVAQFFTASVSHLCLCPIPYNRKFCNLRCQNKW